MPPTKLGRIGTKPILRWAGSKRQILHRLASYWNSAYTRYVEPFAGSSSLFFAIEPPAALLADKNQELIETYLILARQPIALHRRVAAISNDPATYYYIRSQQPDRLSAQARAARFVYLNRYCFNGIYRTNSDGHFNVPYAPRKTGSLPTREQFQACAKLLARATLRACDFGTTLRDVRRGDFVYLDPPYAVESRRVFHEYGPRHFTTADLQRLADHLDRIASKGATFVLSYADCREARKLFSSWSIRRIVVRRNVAGFTGARRHANELLVTNAQWRAE